MEPSCGANFTIEAMALCLAYGWKKQRQEHAQKKGKYKKYNQRIDNRDRLSVYQVVRNKSKNRSQEERSF